MRWLLNLFKPKPCMVCQEKNLRIAELREQIDYLKTLAIPENNPAKTPLLTMEADSVVSASQEIVTVPPEQLEEYKKYMQEKDETISERDRILSGTY